MTIGISVSGKLVVIPALSSVAMQGSAACAEEKMSYGEGEYLNSCAACHGLYGKGDGALATVLKTKPANLTLLKKKSGGEFPYEAVREIIDGRKIVPSHGTREMPIWGRQFIEEDAKTYGPVGGEIADAGSHRCARPVSRDPAALGCIRSLGHYGTIRPSTT